MNKINEIGEIDFVEKKTDEVVFGSQNIALSKMVFVNWICSKSEV